MLSQAKAKVETPSHQLISQPPLAQAVRSPPQPKPKPTAEGGQAREQEQEQARDVMPNQNAPPAQHPAHARAVCRVFKRGRRSRRRPAARQALS